MEEDPTIQELLARLGDTPDEVARNLEARGCKGPPQNDCFCPVAQYLSRSTGKAASATDHVCVLGEFSFDAAGNIDTFIGKEWGRTPKAVGDAIDAYDNGEYAYLRG